VTGSGHIEFPAGTTNQVIRVGLRDDNIDELEEAFLISISRPVNGLISQAEASGVILDDDGPELIVSTEPGTVEGNTGVQQLAVNFTLTRPSVQEISANVATFDGTARAESDYDPILDSITFQPGQTNITVAIEINSDIKGEPDEFFWIEISELQNATIAQQKIKATILNDDGLPGELDSFFFDSLPPILFADQDQVVTILARDGFRNRTTAFSGEATLRAQEAVDALTIGTGESIWEYPVGSFNPSRLQAIYYTNELGGAFSIDSLVWCNS
jgi:hypothetical protein